jgi:hypothetical protein
MSISRQRHHTRSRSILRVVGGTQYAGGERINAERALSCSPQQRPPSTTEAAFSETLFAVMGWITAEFLAGCAQYAQGMFLISSAIHNAVDIVEPAEPAQPAGMAIDRAPRRE